MSETQTLDTTTARIKAALDKWLKPLGLLWWRITVCYYDDPGEIIKRFRPEYENRIVAATCTADWRYAEANIDINLPAWVEMDDEQVERAVVHELMHVLVNEMHEGEMHHEERVVTQLTKAAFWIRDESSET